MMILESKYAESIDYLLKSIQLCYKLDHKQFITTGMSWLSISVGMRGEPDLTVASIHAAQLEGAAEGLMEAIGFTSWAETESSSCKWRVNLFAPELTKEAGMKPGPKAGGSLQSRQ